MAPNALKSLWEDNFASFFLKFRLYLLETTRTCTVTTNNYFSYKTSTYLSIYTLRKVIIFEGGR